MSSNTNRIYLSGAEKRKCKANATTANALLPKDCPSMLVRAMK